MQGPTYAELVESLSERLAPFAGADINAMGLKDVLDCSSEDCLLVLGERGEESLKCCPLVFNGPSGQGAPSRCAAR